MVFPQTIRPDARVPLVAGKRYHLATTEQLRNVPSVRRAWDTQPDSAQDQPLGQPFAEHFDWKRGYGFTFSPQGIGYELANGWDLSATDKASTWPAHATLEFLEDINYRGWWYFDYASGYLYLFRGRYSAKYIPDDSGAQWRILEYHVFGTSGQVVCGAPATFKGKTYVPLCTAATGALLKWQELTTVTTPVTEIQTVTISGTPTGGTYTLSFNDGLNTYTTAAIAYNDPDFGVQSELRRIPGLQQVTVVSSGVSPNFTHTITMTGAPTVLAGTSPPQLTNTDSTTGGTHNIANATTFAGVGDTWTQGPAAVEAGYFTVWNKATVGPVLVRTTANSVSMVSGTPLTAGDWTNPQPVTDSTFNLTAIAVLGRLLYCGAPNGIFSFDEQGIVVNEIPSISSALDSNNFVAMREHNGALLCPHKLGLIRFRSGAAWSIIGAEEDGALEGAETQGGWGRTIGIAPYGKFAYTSINDLYNTYGAVTSLQALRDQSRGVLTPHMHHRKPQLLEDVAICSLRSVPPLTSQLLEFTDDAAVGANAWADPENAATDDGLAASVLVTGQTHYLKGLNASGFSVIPLTATILGITARLKRAAGGASGSAVFGFTGTPQTLVVPPGITSIDFDLTGAGGGAAVAGPSVPGSGARVITSLAVTPGESLTINVGGAGRGGPSSPGIGGYNGGADGGQNFGVGDSWAGGGGGRTGITQGGVEVVIAGGGGGAGDGSVTGGNGGASGQNGSVGANGSGTNFGHGGGGATGATPGAGGTGGTGVDGSPGSGHNGGSGAAGTAARNSSGGGGGGYAGGGGGEAGGGASAGSAGGGGGGGGSSFAGTGTSGTSYSSGYQAGAGYVSATWGATTDVRDAVVQLVKAGSVVGTNKALTSPLWENTTTEVVYGGSSDLWGTTWTVAQLQAGDFGIVVSANVTSGAALIYYLELEVAYQLRGQSDAPSYLVVVEAYGDGSVVQPVAYKLPQAGQPVSNDPRVLQFVEQGALLHTARIYGVTRGTPKRYASFEVYAEIAAAVSGGNVPGTRFEAQVDDSGTWYPLADADGVETFTETGQLELFFAQPCAVGKWVQIRNVIDPVNIDYGEVGMSLVLRDATLRGYNLSRPGDIVQAAFVLASGQQYADGTTDNRSAKDMRRELESLLEASMSETTHQGFAVYDPIRLTTYPAILQGLKFSDINDKAPAEGQELAVCTFQRIRGPKVTS